MTLIPIEGTVLQLVAAAGAVEFRTASETWREPLIGFAVVVDTVSTELSPADGRPLNGQVEYEAGVQPVVLDEGVPTPLGLYLADRETHGMTWRVVQQ